MQSASFPQPPSGHRNERILQRAFSYRHILSGYMISFEGLVYDWNKFQEVSGPQKKTAVSEPFLGEVRR
ncbi:hypothetical protein D3C76_1792590 [compost metagenome]